MRDVASLRPEARRASAGLARAVAVAVLAVVAMFVLLWATGFDPMRGLSALWRGALGSPDAVLSATLVRTIPLLLTGIGVKIALRAGVLNIGADGQLLAGATAAVIVVAGASARSAVWVLPALVAAALAGALWSAVPAWLRARRGTLEVVTTIMMNFVAHQLVSFLVRGPLQEPTGIYPQSATIDASVRLPLLAGGSRLHAGLVIAAAVVLLAWFVLERTWTGYRIRMVGANADAARSAGQIDVARVEAGAFLWSGALAGLAGGVEVLGVTFALYENLSPGYGYTAIAVALLGRLRPAGVVAAALLLGALGAGATAMQRDAGVPAGAAATVEALLVLAVLASQAALLRRAVRA